jgi:uncharacterized repeat protein (TIGR01451 family)
VPPPPSADLAVTKTDSPDPVTAGNNISYTITVANNGPSQAESASASDTLPPGTTFVSATPSQGACVGTTSVSCALGSIANGASATVTLTVQVDPVTPGGAVISNTAEALSRTADPDPSNNAATAATTVVAGSPPVSADLSVTKTDSPDPVTPGSPITYTITVTNNGPADTDSAQITDAVPAGTSFVSVVPTVGSCLGTATFTCDLGPLANGASATVTLVALVDPGATPGTVISNTAKLGLPSRGVSVASVDPNPGNDSATATTTVAAASEVPGEVPGTPGAVPGTPKTSGSPAAPASAGVGAVATPGAAAAAVPVVAKPTFTG